MLKGAVEKDAALQISIFMAPRGLRFLGQ